MRPRFHTYLVLGALLAACGTDSDADPSAGAGDTAADAGADGSDVASDGSGTIPDAGGADGDGGDTDAGADAGTDESYFVGEEYVLPASHANVLRRILFSGELEPGVAEGFDLDGRTSAPGDPESCGHGDLVAPDGRAGIDNQFAVLWAAIQPLVGEQVEELLQGAINEGRVLVIAELEGVDDLQNDDNISFNLYRAILDPDIGTQGLIAPSQTYWYDYEAPLSRAENVAIVDGAVTAGPLRLDLPIQILELDIILPLEGAYIRFDIDETGAFEGFFSGAIHVPSVIEAVLATPAAAEAELVRPIFEANTDMQRVDGVCEMMSATFGFEGTTAFVIRDAAMER